MLYFIKNNTKLSFILIGIVSVAIDWIMYMSMLAIIPQGINIAKIFGFFSGAIFSYLANKIITFGSKVKNYKSLPKFILIYLSSLFINITINFNILSFSEGLEFSLLISFLIATGCSAFYNYVGLKYWVFNEKGH